MSYSEAIIELTINPVTDIEKCVQGFKVDIEKDFPRSEKIASIEARFEAQQELEIKVSSQMFNQGLRFWKSDNSRVILAKANGMTFSHQPQYTNWESFRTEAEKVWKIYQKHFTPCNLTRIGLRYINRVDIDLETVELEDYFNLYPQVPKGIPQLVSHMTMQVQMPQDDLNAMAVINQTTVDPAIEKGFSLILDIDLIAPTKMDGSDDDVWRHLDKLRCRKNKLFEEIITDKTRELIK